ncbi:MAG: DUF3795 domain-containing protein, partial [Chloroflexi bacterium]|nr:DUF3795 domain-containing protein [Chloroflexota bacterium]
MSEWFSKCGCNCARCPAFRGNNKTAEDRQRCSDGWHKYLGVRLNPDRCICDGCQTPDDRNPTLVIGKHGCKIRRCAVFNGAQTCAHCSAYPCEAVRAQFSFDAGSRDRFAARLGAPIPDDEYIAFIETYELHKHLKAIRASLAPADIVTMTPVAVRPRVVGLPPDIPPAFAALHRILAEVGAADGIPHVQQAARQE